MYAPRRLAALLCIIVLWLPCCGAGRRPVRELVLQDSASREALRLTLRFLDGGAALTAALLASGGTRGEEAVGGGHAPYVSVFAFEFVAEDPGWLLAGLDTATARLEVGAVARPVFDPPGLRKAFPDAVYSLKAHLALLRGALQAAPDALPPRQGTPGSGGPEWTPFRVYPAFLVRPGERVRGHFLVPRLPLDRLSGRLLVDALVYREPWRPERLPLVIPFTQAILPEKP